MLPRQYLTQFSLGLGFAIAFIHPTLAQIIPNGAGTIANPQGNQINITGGTQAGANLFHSFRDFNLNSSQIATFLSNPQIQNILARVNGGNPSVINGLLQVSGGNSHLFLMNPSGIIFGANARLNIPASFTATTANQIGFGNNLFNAFGDNNFSALTGNPDSFLFTTTPAGSIVNAGNLSVTSGQEISLIGGNIINTGNLNAPGGNITLAAVPGTNRVRISQPGQLLSLEIIPPINGELRGVDLPRLLTGSSLSNITTNGETLQVAGINVPTGQGINITSGNLSLASPVPVGEGSGVRAINILGDRVALVNANLNVSGIGGGGTIRVGGEYQGRGNNPFNSRITYVDSNSFLNVDAINSGNGGRVIVWADDTTRFYGTITGRGVTGSGGFVEVSGKESLAFDGRVELPGAHGLFGTLLLDPTDITIQAAVGDGDGSLPNIGLAVTPASMTISAGALAAIAPSTVVDIQASNSITFNVPVTFAPCTAGTCGGISFTAGGAFNANGNLISASGRDVNITAQSIDLGQIYTGNITAGRDGGNIILNALNGNINTGILYSASLANGGAISLNATGNLSTAGLYTISDAGGAGNGGAINLSSGGNISTSDLDSTSHNGNAGAIGLNAFGNISTTNISTTSFMAGNAGAIDLRAGGNISTGYLVSSALVNTNGGAVNLSSPNGSIGVNYIFTESATGASGFGGNVNITAGTTFLATGSLGARDSTIASISTQGGAGNSTINITHGGGTSIPFVVGSATSNGTAAAITVGSGSSTTVNNLTVPVPPAINNYGTNISIRTTASDAITPSVFSLLTNPAPPRTPAPVIVGTPPESSESSEFLESPESSLQSSPVVQTPPFFLPPIPLSVGVVPPLEDRVPPPIPSLFPNPEVSPTPKDTPILSFNPSPIIPLELYNSLRGVLGGATVNSQNSLPILITSSEVLPLITNLTNEDLSARLGALENYFQNDFQKYLGINPQVPVASASTNELLTILNLRTNPEYNLPETQTKLNRITETTRVTPALVYVFFAPPGDSNDFNSANLTAKTNRTTRDNDPLEVILVTGKGQPLRMQLTGTTRRQVLEVADRFRSEVTNFRSSRSYLLPAKQMYQWIIAPLESVLQQQGVDNLVFLMDTGLRSIPLAAMHDGKGFIIERYSVGLMPSLNLTPPTYNSLEGSQVLAMGATTFGNTGLNPLPAVSLELSTVSQLWQGSEFLNDKFTLYNLIDQRRNRPFRIVHLATHGVFNSGDRSNSYIQLWDQRLRLDQLNQLNWGNPPVDLLVLSACQTALGDKDAELGFAGLAINAGVRSALASLWEVNDAATLGLMTKFYQQLQVTTTKAEALRQAQLSMLRGEVRFQDGNLVTPSGATPLTEGLRRLGNLLLTHPYYWSAFTIVGNPW